MNKNYKRMALWLAVTMFLFVGCQPKEKPKETVKHYQLNPDKPVTLRIWHYYNGQQKISFDHMVKEFNETEGKKQGIIVEAFSQGSIPELNAKLMDAANKKVGADAMPDIFNAYGDTVYQLDQMGAVVALDDYLTKDELNQYVDSYIEEGRLGKGNKLKIFPTAKSTEVLAVNKTDWDKFAAATGVTTNDLTTWEGVARTAEKYYNYSGGKAFFGRDSMSNYMIIGCRQLGDEIFAVKDGKVKLNVDKSIMRRLWDNFYVPYLKGYYIADGKFRSDDAKTGKIIAFVGSTSSVTYFPKDVTINDLEVYQIVPLLLPAPDFEGGKLFGVQQGAGLAVAKSTEEKEYAATVFLKWFTEVDHNIEFAVSSSYLPVKKEANNLEKIDSIIDKNGNSATAALLKDSFAIALKQYKTHTLYTSKAFQGGEKARKVLETSMITKAKADVAAVQALIAAGTPREKAIAAYDTDANFNSWYQSFVTDLNDAITGSTENQ